MVGKIYSLTAQKDSRTHIQVAEDSKRIAAQSNAMAIAAQRESMNMRAIALVTFAFLPGTFTAVSTTQICYIVQHFIEVSYTKAIQTLFSSSFFNFQAPKHPHIVSWWIWLYWTLTVVLTTLALLTWRYLAKPDRRLTELLEFEQVLRQDKEVLEARQKNERV
jgi:hypothetical protein